MSAQQAFMKLKCHHLQRSRVLYSQDQYGVCNDLIISAYKMSRPATSPKSHSHFLKGDTARSPHACSLPSLFYAQIASFSGFSCERLRHRHRSGVHRCRSHLALSHWANLRKPSTLASRPQSEPLQWDFNIFIWIPQKVKTVLFI